LRGQATDDPELFLNNFQGDLILDEIQYAPKLLSAVKMAVDGNKKRRFILTGSQQFNMIRGRASGNSCRTCIAFNSASDDISGNKQKPDLEGNWAYRLLPQTGGLSG
jgi:hypothetical protein